MKFALIMDENRANHLCWALECVARIGMGQFADMVEMVDPKASYEKRHEIELYLKAQTMPELDFNASRGVGMKEVPEECSIAWDAYQWLRREVSWARINKDWRTDKREWYGKGADSMIGVNYDDPMKSSKLDGGFSTERIEDK